MISLYISPLNKTPPTLRDEIDERDLIEEADVEKYIYTEAPQPTSHSEGAIAREHTVTHIKVLKAAVVIAVILAATVSIGLVTASLLPH